MTAKELAELLGTKAMLPVEGGHLSVPVEVVDARNRYGAVDVKVKPINGTGEKWIAESRLKRRTKWVDLGMDGE